MNRDPNLETEIREKVDELIQKAAEDFMTAEVPPETVVDEEVKQQDLALLKLRVQAQQFLQEGL